MSSVHRVANALNVPPPPKSRRRDAARRVSAATLATVDVPEALAVVVHPQHAVLGIVTLAAIGAGKETANVRSLAVEVFGDGKSCAATARDEKHPGKPLLTLARFGRTLLHSDSVTMAIGPRSGKERVAERRQRRQLIHHQRDEVSEIADNGQKRHMVPSNVGKKIEQRERVEDDHERR